MSAHLEFYVEHAQDDGWELEAGPFTSQDEVVKEVAGYRARNPGHKYRAAVRMVTGFTVLEEEA